MKNETIVIDRLYLSRFRIELVNIVKTSNEFVTITKPNGHVHKISRDTFDDNYCMCSSKNFAKRRHELETHFENRLEYILRCLLAGNQMLDAARHVMVSYLNEVNFLVNYIKTVLVEEKNDQTRFEQE